MPSISELQPFLQEFEFGELFVEGLGWDEHDSLPTVVGVNEENYSLKPIAEKAGFVVYECEPNADGEIPAYPDRRKIESRVAKTTFEHMIVFVDDLQREQVWQWVKREIGKPPACREIRYRTGENGNPILQRLLGIAFSLDEESRLNISTVTSRVKAALDVEKVTKRFYDEFRRELTAFGGFIEGITDQNDRDWYASLTLNRLMFIYFIQKQGFLDQDQNYLRNRLQMVRERRVVGRFQEFYRLFLRRLFHEGLGQPKASRSFELDELLGKVPFLNGGLFDVHDLERDNPKISIPDVAFEGIFDFFDRYRWHLDERPHREDNEINPDVLGYIFEKYVNQKQMGAYYTKEDITGYISRNTIIPFLFDAAKKECPVAFGPNSGVWRLLRDDPDRYIYPAVGHGVAWNAREVENPKRLRVPIELPSDIAAGLSDVSQRDDWNRGTPDDLALPTETWREVVARRQRHREVSEKLTSGDVRDVNDLITLNLDIEQFAKDVIVQSEGPELVRAFWQAMGDISILDPTCGSGAFLFAALNILEPLYTACLEAMNGFLDDLDHTKRPHHGEALRDFRDVLQRVNTHPNERYFTLKAIVLNNLYGVDIMEEAVEICKLRLFLKLVAQLDVHDEIEPLPDIDFNVRAGNTLVGFMSLDAVWEAMTVTPDGQHRTLFEEDRAALTRIEAEANEADAAYNQFRWQQTMLDGAASVQTKVELRRRLERLTDELDRYLATEHNVNVRNSTAYDAWIDSNRPFHWFVEFYGILRKGGFDVVIGNPPYVKTKTIDYVLVNSNKGSFPDIFAYIVLKTLAIRQPDARCGLIVPFSVGFSRDFGELRRAMTTGGTNWFSSFDNIPASLFSGVSQRCIIWISSAKHDVSYTSRLYRWRSMYRPTLMNNINYTEAPRYVPLDTFGIPRLSISKDTQLLRLHVNATKDSKSINRVSRSDARLGYSQTARNFISTYVDPPPLLSVQDETPLMNSGGSFIMLSDQVQSFAALATTAGDACFWYWLARADGFHVTNWLLVDFLAPLRSFPSRHLERLAIIGKLIHEHRNSALVFKKNAGKYVGNYNYRSMKKLTTRSDLVYWSGLGAKWDDVQHLFAYVSFVRAINESVGEKGIPENVKRRFSIPDSSALQRNERLSDIDAWLASHFQVTVDEIEAMASV